MPLIKDVVDAINNRGDITDKTKKIYINKFQKITKNCNNTNFIDKFNDIDDIINTYLKDLSFRTKLTYIGEIFAINFSFALFTKNNFDKLEKYKNALRDNNDDVLQTPEYAKKPLVFPAPIIDNEILSQIDSEPEEEEEDVELDYNDDDVQVRHIETQTEKFENKYIDYIDSRTETIKFKIKELQTEMEQLLITKDGILKIEALM